MARLKASVQALENPTESMDVEQAEADKMVLESVEAYMADNDGKYEDSQVLAWVRAMLASKPCRNQGGA